jgi:transposase
LSYKKTRIVPSGAPDTETQEKFIKIILKTIKKANTDKDIVLFLDPAHQVHNIENSYCWQIKGKAETKTVPSNSGRERLTVIGAMNASTYKSTILTTEDNCDGEMMAVFLKEVRKAYPKAKTIYIFLDNAKYNHSNLVTAEAKRLGIKLKFLPPYSPNLNLIERLWKFMKKKVKGNKYYKTFKEFTAAIHDFFKNIDQYKPELETLLTLNFEII